MDNSDSDDGDYSPLISEYEPSGTSESESSDDTNNDQTPDPGRRASSSVGENRANGGDNITPKAGKKKLKHVDNWKRNVKKRELIQFQQRKPIPNCRCKCSTKLSARDQKFVFEKYVRFESTTEQNIYLQGCVQPIPKRRSRPRQEETTNRRCTSFKYNVQVREKTILLCQSAFLAVHGLKRSRLRRKILKKDAPPKDFRGRHTTRPNRIKSDVLDAVRDFISQLPSRESHYSRSENKLRKYLDSALHRAFLSKHEMMKVSYEMFRKIFVEEFNISFGFPRKDICKVCTELIVSLQQAEINKKEEEFNTLKTKKEPHLRKAEYFQRELSKASHDNNETVLSLCFDYEKNLPVPVTNIQDEYYLRQLWVHNFGVHCLTTKQTTMYMYAEHFAQKGPNEVISCLEDSIISSKRNTHKTLKLFCDNCFSQNKNKFLFTFLDQICIRGDFERIEVLYPVPGHSMMAIDRDFAIIEKTRMKSDHVDNPEYYVNLVRTCKNKNPFQCVFVENSLRSDGSQKDGDRIVKVRNFKSSYTPRIKATIPGIAKARYVEFNRGEPPKMTESYNGYLSDIKLYKVGQNRKLPDTIELAYNEYLQIKPLKYVNVLLHVKHVKSLDIEFFTRTLASNGGCARDDPAEEEMPNIDADTDVYE